MLERATPWVRTTLAAGLALAASSCIGSRIIYPVAPTGEELAEFEAAGPADPDFDPNQFIALNIEGGEYRVVAGDLLEIEIPNEAAGLSVTDAADLTESVNVRVGKEGTIRMPEIDEDLAIAGLSTSEIEEMLAGRYSEKFGLRMSAVVKVTDYKMATVAVIGAVSTPGIHEVRSDRLTLLGALMAAGGIDSERGAQSIKILKPGEAAENVEPVELPVRDSTIPFQDVRLAGGETILVEPRPTREFTVLGLVQQAGVVSYPADVTFNLMQALAQAGGTDTTAAPRYATIYRVRADGKIIGATFRIDGLALVDSSNIEVKAGDVIAVEHTQGSWARTFFSQVFGFRASFSPSGSGTGR